MKPYMIHSLCIALIGGYGALGCMDPADRYESDVEAADVYEGDEALGEAAQAVVAPSTAIWEFAGNQPLSINGVDLTHIPRYADQTGPCHGKAMGTCKLDTRSIFISGGHQTESVTADGKFYNWDIEDGYEPWSSNGGNLYLVARYQTGPCAGKPTGCTFDTRTESNLNGITVDAVTAYGMYWSWDKSTGTLILSGNLHTVDRYALGPCRGIPYGQCKLDTREVLIVNGQQHEYITAYGKYWKYIAGLLDSTGDLTSVSRYASGPCAGVPWGTCQFTTRAFYMLGGQQIESFTN